MFKQNEIESLEKLQQQKKAFDRQLSLQQMQSELIKDYKMKQGDYKIIITIYELNDLEPKSLKLWKLELDQKTACDTFVQVKVGNQIKKTQIKKQTNNPIFDEQLFFQFEKMSVQQLDRSKILFNVYDTKFWGMSSSLIGCFELDWTNIYFKKNHQIYRSWLTLYDPYNELEGPVGYLLVNVAILGQNDQITIHDSAFIKDPLVTIQDTITSPKLPLIDFSISIDIYRAENLIPIDLMSREIRAYVIAKFSGNKIKSSSIKSLNPQWNQCLKIGTQVPNKSKYIILEVRNKNLFGSDNLVGVIKIPFIDLCNQQQPKPQWGHLYGPPMAGKDVAPFNYASKMEIYGDKIGSHYRGRILYKISGKKDVYTKNIKNKLLFKFPYKVAPVIPLKLFTLRIDLIQGFGLPSLKQCYVQICLGQYTLKSKGYKMQNDLCQFFQILEQKKVNLPESSNSMPDLIIYFCNGLKQQNRIGFVRIKASQILNINESDSARIFELRTDKSINIVQKNGACGFITARINLFSSQTIPPPRKKLLVEKMKKKEDFVLKIFLYRGQNLPPANEEGDCDPKIKFSFNGHRFQSQPIMSTYNPIWDEVYTQDINIQDLFSVDLEKCLVCDVYDYEESHKDNYIGSFSVKLNGKMKRKVKLSGDYRKQAIQMIYSSPKWYHIINPNVQVGNHIFGRILISCAIFKKNYQIGNKLVPFKKLEKYGGFNQVKTQNIEKNINFYIIGIREINTNRQSNIISLIKNSVKQLKKIKVKPKITINGKQAIKENEEVIQKLDSGYEVKNHGCQINKMFRFTDVKIPKNKKLSTFIDIKIMDPKSNFIYGSNSVNLHHLRNVFEVEDQNKIVSQQQKLQILNVEELQRKLKKLNLYNRIRKQNQEKQQTAKYISKKRIEIANASDLIPPNEIDNQLRQNQTKDPQVQVEMDRLFQEFEKGIQFGNNEELSYLKDLISSSSNNYIGPKQQKYNTIDEQAAALNLFRSSKKKEFSNQNIEKENQNQLLIPKNTYQKSHTNEWRKRNLDLKPEYTIQSKGLLTRAGQTNTQFQNMNDEENYENQQQLLQKMSTGGLNLKIQNYLFNSMRSALQRNYGERQRYQHDGEIVSNFDLDSTIMLSESSYTQRAINYKNVEKGLKLQQKHVEQAIKKQEQYKYASAVKLSLFKWMRKQPKYQKQTYQDYDTDEQQNLDIIPEWYKGRKILVNDLQHYLSDSRTIETIQIYRGRKIQDLETRVKQKVGVMKMVVVSGEDKYEIQSTAQYYQKLLKQKQFCCRIYVLKGKSLLTNHQNKPTTYLRFIYGDKITQYKQKSVKEQVNPEFYMCHEEWINLPGPSTIRIEVMETNYLMGTIGDKLAKDKLLGYTQVDIEDRYFIKKWHLLDRKPIQLRNLYSEYGIGTQGRLETWIDLVEKKKWLVSPMIKINPPPWDQYELRVIVWSTKDCVFKNHQMQSNDVFVRGQIGGGNYQQTDVHWACRSVGNFNYRFKFPIFYPPKPQDMYSDVFIVQIWDKDVIGYNNLIGETRINLNNMHKIIQKAVKRKKPVAASKKIIEKNMALTDRFWFDVFNHKEKDQFGQLQPQGKVQLSFQLVPIQMTNKQRSNGYGRSQPNVYPTLPQPAGRLSFNILRPFDFLKQILGPNLYQSLCIKFFFILILAIVILVFVFFGSSIVAGLIARN